MNAKAIVLNEIPVWYHLIAGQFTLRRGSPNWTMELIQLVTVVRVRKVFRAGEYCDCGRVIQLRRNAAILKQLMKMRRVLLSLHGKGGWGWEGVANNEWVVVCLFSHCDFIGLSSYINFLRNFTSISLGKKYLSAPGKGEKDPQDDWILVTRRMSTIFCAISVTWNLYTYLKLLK